MKSSVIIFVADDNYIDHVKSIAVNCRIQGKYHGDFAVVCPKNSHAAQEFTKYGFYVLEVEVTGFMQKFYVFDKFFKNWQKALYLDCDIIIQDDISRLFTLLENHFLWMDTEDGKIIEMFFRDQEKENHPETYEWMTDHYPHINTHRIFNTAFILFSPKYIDDRTPQLLLETQDIIHKANDPEKGGTDQQTINIFMWQQIRAIPHKLVGFWGFAEPQNDIASELRGWKGGEIMVGIHYSRWYAPWIEKKPDMEAYLIHHLNTPVNQLYKQNLSQFNQVFK